MVHKKMQDSKQHSSQFLILIASLYDKYLRTCKPSVIDRIKFSRNENTMVMFEEGPYISPKLRTMINGLEYLNYTAESEICGVKTHLNIYKTLGYSNKRVEEIINVMNFIVFYCKEVGRKDYKDDINIKIILSPFKKEIDKSVSKLTAHNVNSGFTTRDYKQMTSSIVIYREEEVIKVLIHELIHALDMDSKDINDETDVHFAKIFKKKTNMRINESFTDSYACFLNVCLASVIYSKKYNDTMYDVFDKFLSYEMMHILYVGQQMALKNTARKEETHVTSYYVLKALNWSILEDFVKYLIDHNYMIGSYRDYALFLGDAINKLGGSTNDVVGNIAHQLNEKRTLNKDIIKTRRSNTIKGLIKGLSLNSIRMSSVDILNI
jgi:hypothetical protein